MKYRKEYWKKIILIISTIIDIDDLCFFAGRGLVI